MTTVGQRKAALYLASLSPADRQHLLAALPAEQARSIAPLIAKVMASGWHRGDLAARALASDIRGLTQKSSLSIDDFLTLTRMLPPDWTARLFAASDAIDTKFLLSLVELGKARQVRAHLEGAERIPVHLREALLAEAAEAASAS